MPKRYFTVKDKTNTDPIIQNLSRFSHFNAKTNYTFLQLKNTAQLPHPPYINQPLAFECRTKTDITRMTKLFKVYHPFSLASKSTNPTVGSMDIKYFS